MAYYRVTDAARYRGHSAEAMAIRDTMTDKECRRQMAGIADYYERMALAAEQIKRPEKTDIALPLAAASQQARR